MSEVRPTSVRRRRKGDNLQVGYRRRARLDVHKDSITANMLVFPEAGERQVRTKELRVQATGEHYAAV